MPTYDYQCRSCGVIAEVVHSMLDAGPTACERCGGELRMLVHPTGIIFKGSGFYRNDSRSSANTKPSPSTGEATAPSKPTDGASTEKSSAPSPSTGGSDGSGGGGSDSSGSGSSGSKSSGSGGSD